MLFSNFGFSTRIGYSEFGHLNKFVFLVFPYLGPVWSSGRCVLVTRHAVGGVRRLRCFTSWPTRCPFHDASPPTWTKLPSWGWRSAICAWTAWSNPVGSAEIKQEIVWCVAVVLSWLIKTQKWVWFNRVVDLYKQVQLNIIMLGVVDGRKKFLKDFEQIAQVKREFC